VFAKSAQTASLAKLRIRVSGLLNAATGTVSQSPRHAEVIRDARAQRGKVARWTSSALRVARHQAILVRSRARIAFRDFVRRVCVVKCRTVRLATPEIHVRRMAYVATAAAILSTSAVVIPVVHARRAKNVSPTVSAWKFVLRRAIPVLVQAMTARKGSAFRVRVVNCRTVRRAIPAIHVRRLARVVAGSVRSWPAHAVRVPDVRAPRDKDAPPTLFASRFAGYQVIPVREHAMTARRGFAFRGSAAIWVMVKLAAWAGLTSVWAVGAFAANSPPIAPTARPASILVARLTRTPIHVAMMTPVPAFHAGARAASARVVP